MIVAPEASKEVWLEADSLSIIIIEDKTVAEVMTAEEIEVLHAELLRIMTRARRHLSLFLN